MIRSASFTDYYQVLEVHPAASTKDIRQSFRRLVLRAHPDKNPGRRTWSERRVRELIQAFEIIGDGEKRQRFDQWYRLHRRNTRQVSEDPSPYFFRRSDPASCARQILYLLLHRRGNEAITLVRKMEARHGAGFLATELEREDYLDCLFLLGEYHLERREFALALRCMRTFYLRECNVRYPRHYIDSVVSHLKDLYFRKLPRSLSPSEALRHLREAPELALNVRERKLLEELTEELRVRLRREGKAS